MNVAAREQYIENVLSDTQDVDFDHAHSVFIEQENEEFDLIVRISYHLSERISHEPISEHPRLFALAQEHVEALASFVLRFNCDQALLSYE